MIVAVCYSFKFDVLVSICLLYFCTFIHLSLSSLIFDEKSACHMSIFSFLDEHLSKYQWIFTKLGMYIHIVWIWFGIANGQILSIFDRINCLPHVPIFVS